MAPSALVNTDDLAERARRYLPKILFDWAAGGAGDEAAVRDNRTGFDRYGFMPRYLRDVRTVSTEVELFGQRFALPIGIAPMGYAGVFRPGAELFFAEAAKRFGVPYIMSGTSVGSIEAAAPIAGPNLWYQLYPAHDERIGDDMIRRADACGCGALVITVDLPAAANRERDTRNGLAIPMRWTPQLLLDGITHPGWTWRYLRDGGLPRMENWSPYLPAGASALAVARFSDQHAFALQTWDHLAHYRRLWPRTLVVKGINHPDDAAKAKEYGVDGIIVSNHGGRQYDRVVHGLDCLPAIRAAVGPAMPLMLDGGLRRGADILVALGLGFDLVFAGRPFLYGAAALAQSGVDRAMTIFRDETVTLMRQIGCVDLGAGEVEPFIRTRSGAVVG